MTLDGLLTAALDLAYFAVFGFTLRSYLRRREPVGLAVVLVFGSLALVLAVSVISAVAPGVRTVLGLITLPAFLAEPILALWLVNHFRPVPRALLLGGAAGFVALVGLFVILGLAGTNSLGSAGVAALVLLFIVYFVVIELAAGVGLALAARRRAGAARTRLAIAAVSTALLAAAVLVLILGGVATAGTDATEVVSLIGRLMALLAALGYLAAFAPPRILRRLSQQTIAYDFIRDLNQLPNEGSAEPVWALLERTAVQATGAVDARIRFGPAPIAGEPSGARILEVPLLGERGVLGALDLRIAGEPLFVEDDLALIGLLADRAVRAAERETFVLERVRLIADLRAAGAAKSDFLAAMSHELRTPLNAIIGFSELLTDPDDDLPAEETVRTYANHIHDSGLHLLELVNDVLDLARVEAGRLDLKPVAFDMNELVQQTVQTMQPLADRKSIDLSLNGAVSRPLVADPSRIRQVAFNLLSNAIKFTASGGTVRLELDADEAEVRLSVVDTGPGIEADDLERIFEAFQQGTPGGRPQTEGTGLGLALTRQLVEAHGGRIDVVSAVGAGSTFTVHVPTSLAADRPLVTPPLTDPDRSLVLVIEDDPAAAELLRVYLDGAGYAVAVTESGAQGLAWADQLKPDAIVLDILLPELDGWEILQRLKRNESTRSIPVLVVSVVDDRPLGLALGAVDYFVKPIARDSLLEAIGRLTFTTKVRTRTVTTLVIDADPEADGRYRSLLEPEGFRVEFESSGVGGTERALDLQPDLILLDVLLPDIDGFEVVARLKADPATSAIPIWVTTPPDLRPEDKARLNGNVLGIADRGDAALEALRGWLNPLGRPAIAK